ncbi:hypothetical protein [Ferrovibrio sp.]|uniref:hypothetical protein n=1 Tax=Ferrovibrio sp. TaxID=1917215 RepID=UPI0035116A63
MPDPVKPGGSWAELDAAAREARLAAKLRANLARRKQQGRARDADARDADARDADARDADAGADAAGPVPARPGLDREDGGA